MKQKTLLILSAIALVLIAGFARVGNAAPFDGPGDPPSKEKFEKVKAKIEEVRKEKLTKLLNLDEKTAGLLFSVLAKYDTRRFELQKTMRESMRELRSTLKSGGKDDQLKPILAKLEQNRKEMHQLMDDQIAELKNILTVQQQAKYVLFQVEFHKEIRHLIDGGKDRRQGREGKGGPHRPRPAEEK